MKVRSIALWLWLFLLQSAFTGSVIPSAALADQNLNCNQYASQAIAQQKQNQDRGCGFQGIGWSANFKAHSDWCQLDIVKMAELTQAHNFRADAIKQCIAKIKAEEDKKKAELEAAKAARKAAQLDIKCASYAITARDQNQDARKNKCGFTAGGWSDDVNAHRAWCLGRVDPLATAKATEARAKQLDKCKTVKVFNNPQGRRVKSRGRSYPLHFCVSNLEGYQCGAIIANGYCRKQRFKVHTSYLTDSASTPHAPMGGTLPSGPVSSYLDLKGYCGGRTCKFFAQITCKGVN